MLWPTRLENCNRNNRQGFSADLAHPLLLASLLNPDPGALSDPTQSVKLPALERAEALRPVFAELAGLSHRAAAKALNERGIKTATGKAWTAVQVIRVRERLASHAGPAGGKQSWLSPATSSS